MKKTLLLALVVSGCGDAVSPPPPPMRVTITSTTTSPTAWNENTQRFECYWTFTATASGGSVGPNGGDAATWFSGEYEYRYEGGATYAWDLSAEYLTSLWGSSRIYTGAVLTKPVYSWDSSIPPSRFINIQYSFRLQMPDLSLIRIPVLVNCA